MTNKAFIIWLFIAIISSTFLNHKVYGNSNITRSNYEGIKDFHHDLRKKKSAKVMADYMYKRIRTYQKYGWYERYNLLWDMHEALQNME